MNNETTTEEIELTWMPVYWEKLLAGTTHMDAAELGGYILLIAEQWKKGFVTADEKKLMKIARQRSKEKLQTILEKFKPDGNGNLINKVCAEIRIEQTGKYLKNKISGKKGAEKRWRKDGDPNAVAKVSAIAEVRSKKEETTKVVIHQQHKHEEFAEKIFTEEHEQDRVNIELQLVPKPKLLHPLDVRQFNAHLHTAKKVHETFHEWQTHLRNWINTKPKLTVIKNTKDETGKSNDSIGRVSRKTIEHVLNRRQNNGDSQPDSDCTEATVEGTNS